MQGRTPLRPAARSSPNQRRTLSHSQLPTASLIKHRGYSSNFQFSNKIKAELAKSGVETLSKFQFVAAIIADEHQLNIEDLKKAKWFNSMEHVQTFDYFVNRNGMNPSNALEVMANLTPCECYGLRHGLDKEDILGLNKIQIRALIENKKFGLKASHLRNQNWFNSRLHVDALSFRLRDDSSKEVSATVEALKNIAEDKFQLIRTSFGLHHMQGVTDKDISALHALNVHFGLTAADICFENWFTGPYLFRALYALAFNNNVNIKEAIIMLSKLDEVTLQKLENREVEDVLDIRKGTNLSV